MSKNNEKASVESLESPPSYLGLGTLDANSVVKSQDKISANYTLDNETLYKVSVSATNCQIVEYLGGNAIATTSGHKSLSRAFFYHFMSQPPNKSKRLERLFNKLADNRNIFVRFAQQPPYLFYPAGYIVCLRQPIANNNKSIFSKTEKALMDSNGIFTKLDKRNGIIIKLLEIGDVTVEQVIVADFSTTLLHLARSVDMLWGSGIVPEEKEYRLTVMDNSERPAGNISIYLGDISRGFLTFSVIVTEGADLDLEQVQSTFRESSFQFLESLKK